MKKWFSFLLVTVLIVTLTGITYAASASFSDVPAKHWAYDAVTKLADAGLIDGYGDGTFRGDKAMNRYEFAVMTQKAMEKYEQADDANKKLIDSLSAEFATELNRMGARVAKVEAKTNTWIGGDTRMRIMGNSPSVGNKLRGADRYDFRQRIKFWGTINDNMMWQGRLSSNWGNKWGNTDSSYGSTAYFDIMNVTAKNVIGLDSIRAGRSALDVIGYGFIGKPMAVDGVLINKKIGDAKFSAYTGNIKSDTALGTGVTGTDSGNSNQLTTGQVRFNVNKNLDMGLGYYWADIQGTSTKTGLGTLNTNIGSFTRSKGYDLSVKYKMGDLTLLGDYIDTKLVNPVGLPDSPNGWVVQLSNGKGPGATAVYYNAALLVDPAKKGSDAWSVSYRSVDPGTIPSGGGGFDTTAVAYPTQPYNIFTHSTDNVNAWYLTYENVLAKNVVLSLEYQDFKVKNRSLTNLTSDNLDKAYRMQFEFFY
ncbi:MAG: S-layer homology domain-containing protein [Veillonellales bacterium]